MKPCLCGDDDCLDGSFRPIADIRPARHGVAMAEFESLDGDDSWDEEFADDLVGSTLLVGLTYVDHDDQLIRRQQLHGTVISVDRHSGIVIRQDIGEDATIAPVLDAIEPAQPGIYQLADEDVAVEDPDFTALLTVRAPLRS